MADKRLYWAGVFRYNASVQFLVGEPGSPGVERKGREFVGYNVFMRDEYERMQCDSSVSPPIKDLVRQTALMQGEIGSPHTAPNLEG